MPRWMLSNTQGWDFLHLKYTQKKHKGVTSGIATLAIRVKQRSDPTALGKHPMIEGMCLNEGWYTIHDENKILNTTESSNHNTNVVSTPQEPFIFNQDPGVNSLQSHLQSNHNCCFECGDSLDGIFCQRCTCKSCGNGAHIGYNCPPQIPIISNSEQCNQTINELPQTLPSVHSTCNYEDENSFTYDSKPNSFNDSPSVLTYLP
ncbi:hypothetical protein Tco_0077884 [Tanacetum coccineum]